MNAGNVRVGQPSLGGLAAADEQSLPLGQRKRFTFVGTGDDEKAFGHVDLYFRDDGLRLLRVPLRSLRLVLGT